ncbi:hypothetical protein Dsin_017490 [Dipteronia sinensis]|uniref:RNase H type-1 domain-containing protein n=1 Tax=Dipteronia sinensis TaxID=43782 RepID=A0AAE0AF40_9ROSI|nr:hypothetical protein Dsin_017490 [Dipteronia sinensis]
MWKLPDMGVYKLNCDAAVDVAGGFIGIGLVIRDAAGFEARCVEIGFVSRNYNKVAHVLARNALLHAEDRYWMEEYPTFVRSFVQADFPC